MTIEEVSVIFDTGRKGDAQAAAHHFDHGKQEKMLELTSSSADGTDGEKQSQAGVATHVEVRS